MMEIRYTLLSDGSSDRALIPILNWLLQNHLSDCAIQPQWADLRRLDKSLRNTFDKRIKLSLELYPCELLFIHRDAERETYESRVNEIRAAVSQIASSISIPTVCVVPVRMTEAWLLFDAAALRKAAANPNGNIALQIPDIRGLERESDPKNILHDILRQASGLSARRLRSLSVSDCTHRVSELINDFSPLRILPAFAALEAELSDVIKEQMHL
ncbi:MAG: hypothetical protein HC840_22225 [Leptolyngbyaceae cyanobacterium RM2_2_4]|nr:hypothetical protein [Leptolyngbyaceae cyanobacterium SM1_4_3]NJN90588.1 hypothetical protein [Leptolyngbyaceae cyanobacterium SL_5_14]NJO51683.1 hypothetical protein [Leptolyngbyaceae cyanobacterium RM2_2_4]